MHGARTPAPFWAWPACPRSIQTIQRRAAMAAMQNPAISAQYEPGSVFKVFTAAAVLDTGLSSRQKLTDTGSIAVGDRVILNSTAQPGAPWT